MTKPEIILQMRQVSDAMIALGASSAYSNSGNGGGGWSVEKPSASGGGEIKKHKLDIELGNARVAWGRA